MSPESVNIKSKHAKYLTGNPISKYLVGNFFNRVNVVIRGMEFNSIVDIGCGEGLLLSTLKDFIKKKKCFAIDLDETEVKDATVNLPFCSVRVGSAEEIPLDDNSFDFVTCTEVLEHCNNPYKALSEIHRVSKKFVLLSVPREPIWRILNLIRFSYIKDFGNTPGHLNHWSSRSFEKFVSSKFKIIKVSHSLPWTIILAEK